MPTTAERIRAYRGPTLFSYGFRPFFLGGAIWAALSMAVWLLMLTGGFVPPTLFTPIDWHIHELLYGYVPAVIAGFLLTAVPNWTGRMPVTGAPLIALFLVWIAGRIAIFVSALIGPWPTVIIDGSFLLLLSAVMGREIIAGNNKRNLKVLVLALLLALGNIVFHGEAAINGVAAFGQRLGIAAALLLIMLIGGRIVPSFTRNWLARRGPGAMPTPMNRLDIAVIIIAGATLALWVASPDHPALAPAALVAALAHGVRMGRWAGYRTFGEPMVIVLHAAYAFIPLGFLLLAATRALPQVVSSG
ncbi:MAG: NnrS family protein, partial [Alphaproteobacteria bacterium]